jgi:hypothetical protein
MEKVESRNSVAIVLQFDRLRVGPWVCPSACLDVLVLVHVWRPKERQALGILRTSASAEWREKEGEQRRQPKARSVSSAAWWQKQRKTRGEYARCVTFLVWCLLYKCQFALSNSFTGTDVQATQRSTPGSFRIAWNGTSGENFER